MEETQSRQEPGAAPTRPYVPGEERGLSPSPAGETDSRPGTAPEETESAPAEPEAASTPEAAGEPESGGEKKALSNDAVTDHTASLWRYRPVPQEEPEPAPEYRCCHRQYPGSTVTAAGVRGKKHKHEGSNCDDWFETAQYDSVTFIAVSDGAGSKKLSRIGARVSCRAAVGCLVTGYEELVKSVPDFESGLRRELSDPACQDGCGRLAQLVQQAVTKAYEAVEAAWYERAADPVYTGALGRRPALRDFSGTLLLAVIVPICPETKEHLIVGCQVGDGMIAVLNSQGDFASSLRLLGVPDSGAYSGETDFLTSPQVLDAEALQKRTMLFRRPADTVLVMSDGVSDDYFPNETQMRRLYDDLVVNGVIDTGRTRLTLATASPEELSLFKRLPDPPAYPWVNDQSVKVPLHYTKRILETTGSTLETLWDDPRLLDLATAELRWLEETPDPAERLRIWLDNYVERGSFDDRTLVIARM